MYRNCPEHPVIKEMLRNGESCCPEEINTKSAVEAGVMEVFEHPEAEFAEICLKRKKRSPRKGATEKAVYSLRREPSKAGRG